MEVGADFLPMPLFRRKHSSSDVILPGPEELAQKLKLSQTLASETSAFGITLCGVGPSKYCRDQTFSGSGKCFQELISEKITEFIARQPLSGIHYRLQQFSGFPLLAGQITGTNPKAINSSKRV